MKMIDVKIHKVIVPIKPDTVHSEGIEDKFCAAVVPDEPSLGETLDREAVERYRVD